MAAHLDAVHSAPGDGRGVGGRRSVVGVVAPCARRRAERFCRGQFLLGLGLGPDPAVRLDLFLLLSLRQWDPAFVVGYWLWSGSAKRLSFGLDGDCFQRRRHTVGLGPGLRGAWSMSRPDSRTALA